MGTPALPFCQLILRGPKPLDPQYPTHPRTLGEHLLKRRLDLGLTRKDLGQRIGCNPWTVLNWERDRTRPARRFMPRIVELLGYGPHPGSEAPMDVESGAASTFPVPDARMDPSRNR